MYRQVGIGPGEGNRSDKSSLKEILKELNIRRGKRKGRGQANTKTRNKEKIQQLKHRLIKMKNEIKHAKKTSQFSLSLTETTLGLSYDAIIPVIL